MRNKIILISLSFLCFTLCNQASITNPSLEGVYDNSVLGLGVKVVGNYAYVANRDSGLRIINISNPNAPVLTGTLNTAGYSWGVDISGDYAYIADGSAGLQIINISNPSAPVLTGTYNTSGSAYYVYVSGSYAYIADGSAGLNIVDISNPAAPVSIGSYNTPGSALGVQIIGNYAYISDGSFGLRILDVSNPAAPVSIGSCDTSGSAYGIYVSGSYAYIADDYQGLKIIDITNPASPTLTGDYYTSGKAYSLKVSGNFAYIADYTGGMKIINISDPSSPVLISADNTSTRVYWLDISGDYAYLVGDPTFSVVNIKQVVPTVVTSAVYDVSFTSATCGGNVTDEGDGNGSTTRGLCWSTSPNPVITDSITNDGSGEGSYLSSITGLSSGIKYYARAYATNSIGTGYGDTEVFTTKSVTAPLAITNHASGVHLTGAVLNGTVNANNQTSTVIFEYGITTAYGSVISADQSPVSGTADTSVSAGLSGLSPNTSYHFRVVASNASGTGYGTDQIFTTGGTSPAVTTYTPAGTGATETTLQGLVNANNQSTSVSFEYGTSTGYGNTVTADQSPVSGISNTSVSRSITGLTPDTVYHYRAVGVNSSGTSYGADISFTTTGGELPEIRTSPVMNITPESAVSGGTVISEGDADVTARGVCWSLSANPGINNFHTSDGSGTGTFTSKIKDLIPDQTYFLRAFAKNKFGTSYGQTLEFSTPDTIQEIRITNPLNNEIVSDTVNIIATTTLPLENCEFYLDNTLLGRGKKILSDSAVNHGIVVFNIENADYLFIDHKNILKKITFNRDIENVFNIDIKVNNISFKSRGEIYIDLLEPLITDNSEEQNSIIINLSSQMVCTGPEKICSLPAKNKKIREIYNALSGNHRIDLCINKSEKHYETLAFLRAKPLAVIKVPESFSGILNSEYSFGYTDMKNISQEKTEITQYSFSWNTLNSSDGSCTVKVLAQDCNNRVVSHEISVSVRNVKITLNAVRKDIKGYTFRAHVADIKFIVENKKMTPVSHYILFKKISSGEFEEVARFDSSADSDNIYSYYDKNIEKNRSFTYKVKAIDKSGNTVSESTEKTI